MGRHARHIDLEVDGSARLVIVVDRVKRFGSEKEMCLQLRGVFVATDANVSPCAFDVYAFWSEKTRSPLLICAFASSRPPYQTCLCPCDVILRVLLLALLFPLTSWTWAIYHDNSKLDSAKQEHPEKINRGCH